MSWVEGRHQGKLDGTILATRQESEGEEMLLTFLELIKENLQIVLDHVGLKLGIAGILENELGFIGDNK